MRLQVTLQKPSFVDFLDERVAPSNRLREDFHHFLSDEFYTPGGMPLRIDVSLGVREELTVHSASTVLLLKNNIQEYLTLDLWLTTDEVLRIYLRPS